MKYWLLDKETEMPLYFRSISEVTDYVTKTLGYFVVLRRKTETGYLFSAGDFYLPVHEVEAQ